MSQSYRLKLSRNALKLRVSPRIPAQLDGGNGIEVTKTSGIYTVDLDYEELNTATSITDLYEPTTYLALWESSQDMWSKISIEDFYDDVALALEGEPIVILCAGQSNFVQRPAQTWIPAPNVLSWNWDDIDTHVGTAFVAVPGSTINLPEAIASFIAYENPLRPVYVIGIAIGSQSIAHWMTGTAAPDMYANTTANMVPALAAIGVSKIDYMFWWQGENQTASPELYVSNFNTVMDRFKAETWFPRATPVTIFGVAPSTISGSIITDTTNATLQAVVRSEPDVRRMVYTGTLGAAYWADTLHPNGPGFLALGQMGANAALHGETHLPMLSPLTGGLNNGSTGRPAFRNLLRGGDFTMNPWRNGTSFSSVANGTTIVDNITWVTSGAGVVDILKTADAPTVAQAGMFTQHCLHVDVTTADASIAGVDYYGLQATINGLDSSWLGYGQTGAKSVVVSFWVKSTITGNYFVAIENSAQNRSYNSQYTVNAADTWEYKRVVISGDTSGTWLYTSGVGLRVLWTVASSDNYLFTPDVWNAADVRVGNATRANGMSSTSNNFKLALVQVEEGVFPSVFDRVPSLETMFSALYQPLDADLTALAANASTGLWSVTGAGTGSVRTITGPAAGITVSNGGGVAGNPTLALANDLSALEGLGSTGIAVRSAADTWVQRSVAGTANEITLTNGDGVAGNPTASLPTALTFTGKTVTGGTFATITASGTWAVSGTWTIPAVTLGGTVTSNGQSFSGTIANLGTVTTADINGGTLDGTVIGGASAAAGTFTTIAGTTATLSSYIDLTEIASPSNPAADHTRLFAKDVAGATHIFTRDSAGTEVDISLGGGGGAAAATQAEQETGSSTSAYTSPGRQQYHPSAAKAWVRFDGTGAIQASYNVASVSRASAGQFTVNFTTSFSSANFGVSVTTDASAGTALFGFYNTPATGSVKVTTLSSAFAVTDPTTCTVICFGDQ